MPSPNFKIGWTGSDARGKIGLFAFQNASSIPGITSITVNHTTNDQGYLISAAPDLVSILFPNLASLTQQATLFLDSCPNLITINIPVLASTGNGNTGATIQITNNSSLTNLSFPSLVTCNSFMTLNGNGSLAVLSMPIFLPTNAMSYSITGARLDQASVNAFLARCVASAGFVTGAVDLSGGSSAAPSGQGATDAATLIGRGVTVTTN